MHAYLADDFVHGGAVGGRGAGDRIGKRTPESECGGGGVHPGHEKRRTEDRTEKTKN